ELERRLADFLGCADALVYSNGYLANVGLFDSLFDARDYIIVDAAVHPSLAEGIRLCGARVAAYRSEDLENLEDRLKRSKTARFRVVVTDGIYPLTGRTAALDAIVKLARRFDALVVVHDSLGIGVLGARQRGTTEHCGVTHRVDLITGGFTDVLGGTPGGFVAGRSEVVSWLRQKSTPYLFSGALGPGDVAATDAALDLIDQGEAPAVVLDRAAGLKELLLAHDFKVSGEGHAILAIEVGTVVTLQRMINALSELHVYVQGMCYPVVPENAARIQLKLTPAHTESVLKAAVERIAQAAHTLHSP
ncbi:MAG: aminotransferase class I/II-fold pyridoxal phosphate-dependent enzyme, partial [Myxococcota bacterium]